MAAHSWIDSDRLWAGCWWLVALAEDLTRRCQRQANFIRNREGVRGRKTPPFCGKAPCSARMTGSAVQRSRAFGKKKKRPQGTHDNLQRFFFQFCAVSRGRWRGNRYARKKITAKFRYGLCFES